MKSTLFCAAILAALSGCASVAVNDDSLQNRTASALSLQKDEFTISDRTDTGIRTDYTVTTRKNQVYSCYVTGTVSVVGRVVSDAMCTPVAGTKKGAAPAPAAKAPAKECNALLKAAGRC